VNESSVQGSGYTYLAPKVLHPCSKEIVNEVNNQDSLSCWQEEEVIQTMKLVYYLDCQEQNQYNELVYNQTPVGEGQCQECDIKETFMQKAHEVLSQAISSNDGFIWSDQSMDPPFYANQQHVIIQQCVQLNYQTINFRIFTGTVPMPLMRTLSMLSTRPLSKDLA